MNIKDLVSVSGLPGIYKSIGSRKNGLMLEDLESGKRKFASQRKHQFTPLEGIGIYTDEDDTIELGKVFQQMIDAREDHPVPQPTVKPEELREYFTDVVPNHDQDQVRISDIKKAVRWFHYLDKTGYLAMEPEADDAGEEE